MNRSVAMVVKTTVSGRDFFACSISVPKIIYHGLRFDK
jgi:hypothetical protein